MLPNNIQKHCIYSVQSTWGLASCVAKPTQACQSPCAALRVLNTDMKHFLKSNKKNAAKKISFALCTLNFSIIINPVISNGAHGDWHLGVAKPTQACLSPCASQKLKQIK